MLATLSVSTPAPLLTSVLFSIFAPPVAHSSVCRAVPAHRAVAGNSGRNGERVPAVVVGQRIRLPAVSSGHAVVNGSAADCRANTCAVHVHRLPPVLLMLPPPRSTVPLLGTSSVPVLTLPVPPAAGFHTPIRAIKARVVIGVGEHAARRGRHLCAQKAAWPLARAGWACASGRGEQILQALSHQVPA